MLKRRTQENRAHQNLLLKPNALWKAAQQLFSDENTLEDKLKIRFDGDIYHELGDVKARKIIDKEKYNAYNLFQENTKLKPSTAYRKNLFNLNETSFEAGHRIGVGKSMASLQQISSKARK